ncbi:type VI secretion system Vgr family protein, partial [Vogesella oryzae]|uniref:type VI secretion system Vgr family protein n=1 Tax=Vogesella oryzae TaxID=1735285 RepID=UPI0015843F07
ALALARPRPPHISRWKPREPDSAFITRLLREEGLSWRYEHLDGETPQVKLLAFDDPYALPAANVERVRFHRSDATEEEDGLTRWEGRRQVVSGSVALATYDYQPVATGHSADDSAIDQGQDGARLQSSLQSYDAPGAYYASDADQLGHYARLRQQAHDAQAKTFSGAGVVRGLTAGQWFRLDGHPAHEGDGAEQREFVLTRQTLAVRNNLPAELSRSLPAALRPTLAASDESSAAPFRSEFDAQRRGIPLTPVYADAAHAKPTARGAQTATVVGPEGEEVHTDANGRIKVQFHWQRAEEHPDSGANLDERSSCWLRVAMPSAGAAWGHQFIPRIGQEVLVDFIEGDIDRPVITGVLYNGSHPTPNFSGAGKLPGNKTLSGIKSKEHHGGQYNELLFDDTPNEVRAKLSSEHGSTQLNQGYLTHPRADGKATPRGDGFELRTDRHGAIRAGHGLLLTTEAQNGAGGKQLARDGAQSQLDAALALAQSLADTATAQLADTLETGPDEIKPDNGKGGNKTDGHLQHHVAALKAWEAGSNTDQDGKTAAQGNGSAQAGQQPIMILSAPAGLAAVSDNSLTLAAGSNIDQVAQRDLNQTSGRRWLHNVGQHISLFVAGVKDAVSLKLIAAKGKVQLQAQSDAMELTADKDVTITACKGKVVISAKQDILLTSGGGYIKLSGGNIDIHCPGTVSVKGVEHGLSGPASMRFAAPRIAGTKEIHDEQFKITSIEGLSLHQGYKYQMTLANNQTVNGTLDKTGSTTRHYTKQAEDIDSIEILPNTIIKLDGGNY